MPKRSGLPPNVTETKDRHGKWRLRFRHRGRTIHYFRHPLGSEEFRLELEQCRAGTISEPLKSEKRMKPGSISALIGLYYGTPEFTGLKPLTRKTYRSTLERFREKHGDKRVEALKRTHLKVILGEMAETPAAANNLLDRLRSLMRLAVAW